MEHLLLKRPIYGIPIKNNISVWSDQKFTTALAFHDNNFDFLHSVKPHITSLLEMQLKPSDARLKPS